MGNVAQKRNMSSMQVIKTLKILLEDNYTMAEILEKLNNNEQFPIFNNSVVSKYINTCRHCGVDIHKIQNRYFVADIPFGLKFNRNESESLIEIRNTVEEKMSKKSIEIFNSFLDRINKFASKKIGKVEKGSYTAAFEVFERALANRKKVRLLFINSKTIEGIPVTIVSSKGKLFFDIYTNNRHHMYDTCRISAVCELDERFCGYFGPQNVVYTLKDDLAKRYEIKENETLLSSNSDNSITVTNKCMHPQMLISRLMRYDEKCEINNPDIIRKQMKSVIDNTLKNYGIE